ncbi:Chibby family [Plasmopara halstedii]|uniref:Chibby family n=1 Tax=Plasmopara halstedii TaxID=4781 RepID=A0A0P1ANK5_PLAHL|nr:Chibby family [Plasmopara halstedii]CEG42844.1 Chibby family [Plasmopara halstedii]|eukprot:XP_024579213.1 Chibby family [Plasmopara halstedii]
MTLTASPSEVEMKAVNRAIPINLSLGPVSLSLDAFGQWRIDDSTLQQAQERVKELEARNAALESEVAQLQTKCTSMMEESNMEKFKCQLLIEMLAVSSLDEERTRTQADQEKARANSIQSDMAALLELARAEGMDVRKLNTALTTRPLAP